MARRAPNPVTDLYALVYSSKAHHELSLDEIDRILDAAQRHNDREAITGLLLYNRGRFMQYLEGPPQGVRKVFERIKADPRHGEVIELVFEPIASRKFGEWSMAFRSSSAFGHSAPATDGRTILQRIGDSRGSATASELLSDFWRSG